MKNVALQYNGPRSKSVVAGLMLVIATLFVAPGTTRAAALLWDANSETNIAGYRVYYGQASRVYTTNINVGNVTQWQLSGLQNGAIHYFAVTAYDTDGLESEFSVEVSYTPTPSNQPPTISLITDQSISWNTSTVDIPFTVGDDTTAANSLVLSAASSNTGLISTNGILFAGSGSNRTVRLTPLANQTGNSTITISISDGQLIAQRSFTLTVMQPARSLFVSDIPSQIINEDTFLGPVSFVASDNSGSATALAVSAVAADEILVPVGNITLDGTGTNRTIRLMPALNLSGTTVITVTVTDGSVTASNSFQVAILPVNDVPTISAIANQSATVDATVGPLAFTIHDIETAASSLAVSATTSNPQLFPSNNILMGGSGTNRTIALTPSPGQIGTGVVSVAVSDGILSASNSFTVTISAAQSFVTFSNRSGIMIQTSGPGVPSPSTIPVGGVDGTIASLSVTIEGLAHTWPDDVDVVLVGPSGQGVILISDIGGNIDATNITLTLSDTAQAELPDQGPLTSGTFRPTNVGGRDKFSGLPDFSSSTGLNTFNGGSANGSWNLYVMDDGKGDSGAITGWNISFAVTSAGIEAAAPVAGINALGIATNSVVSAINQKDHTPALPSIVFAGFDSNGCGQIRAHLLPSQKYRLEASTDLVTWRVVDVGISEVADMTWTDCEAGSQVNFYRLAEDW